jgi:hypothetical protein
MIKSIKKIIKDSITQGVTTLPLKRNLISRFMKGGGAQVKMNDALIAEKRGYQNSRQEESFSVSHVTFPPMSG